MIRCGSVILGISLLNACALKSDVDELRFRLHSLDEKTLKFGSTVYLFNKKNEKPSDDLCAITDGRENAGVNR
jgi:hypothetical protein